MRKFAVVILMCVATAARATVRCPGTAMQTLNVDSGQSFTLPVVPVTGVLDYEVARAAQSTLNNSETWSLGGSIVTSRIRQESGAPLIRERLFNTNPEVSFSYAAYYVVTAINAFDPAFHPCAQDFLVNVKSDPLLSRDAVRAVIPVAGSLKGANNSTWRTRLTLENPWSGPISGRVIFHPSGQAGSATDPSVAYSLDTNAVTSWDDVVAAMPAAGIGSLDIVPDRSSWGNYPMPKVRAQVVSVAPAGGSFGTDVPAIAMTSPQYGAVWTDFSAPFLIIDDQNGAKRLAIGVRTLADSVVATLQVVDPDGTIRATVTRTWPADYHEQRPLSEWFGTVAQRNDRIVITAQRQSQSTIAGGMIVYLAETDNVTNDVSVFVPQQNDFMLLQPVVQCSCGCSFVK